MSVLTDILDRLSGISAVNQRVADLVTHMADMRKVMIEQQKDIAELKGQLKAMIQIQSAKR
jgi:hypothetical protein